jgi:hypothetical protein
MKRLHLLLLGLVVLTACGSDVEGGGNGGSGGSGGSDVSSSSSGSSGGSSVQCVGNTPMFPMFDKTCTVAADCVTALHMINCCGTLTAIGINVAEKPAFDAAESTCQMQYPGCGCAQFPTTTEDGKMSMDDNQIQVACSNGQCMTFLP